LWRSSHCKRHCKVFGGNSITLEDEKAAVVSLGCVLMSEGEKGEIVKEGGDVHIAISDFP
jgi:hypothetical protein